MNDRPVNYAAFLEEAAALPPLDMLPPVPSLLLINPAEWEGIALPPREWIVKDFIPAKTVTLLSGEGAAGKSTIALQLAAARALGRQWLSTLPKPGRTLVISAEDDTEEMHRRLDAIREHYGVRFSDLSDIRLVDLVGLDAVFGALHRNGTIRATALFHTIVAHIEKFQPDLVIVDALADAFAGDENNRAQARQFVGMLKGPARRLQCAFLTLAHPSLTGINTGTGQSGSTAWGNSVRSRVYFERAKASDGSEPDPDMRTLTTNKANYGPAGVSITMKWISGIYVVQTGPNSLDKMAFESRADETFLELLNIFSAQGQEVSPKPSQAYAPKLFAEHPKAAGIGKKAFAATMQRLLDVNRILIEISGPPSRRKSILMPVNGKASNDVRRDLQLPSNSLRTA